MLAPEGDVCINELKTEEHGSHSQKHFDTCTLFSGFITKMFILIDRLYYYIGFRSALHLL